VGVANRQAMHTTASQHHWRSLRDASAGEASKRPEATKHVQLLLRCVSRSSWLMMLTGQRQQGPKGPAHLLSQTGPGSERSRC
jgi:hypothetical protein